MNIVTRRRSLLTLAHSNTFKCSSDYQNGPETFPRALYLIHMKEKSKTILDYMYTITFVSEDIEEHLHDVDEIITTLSEAGVTLNLKMCHFFCTSVDYLVYIIKPGRL